MGLKKGPERNPGSALALVTTFGFCPWDQGHHWLLSGEALCLAPTSRFCTSRYTDARRCGVGCRPAFQYTLHPYTFWIFLESAAQIRGMYTKRCNKSRIPSALVLLRGSSFSPFWRQSWSPTWWWSDGSFTCHDSVLTFSAQPEQWLTARVEMSRPEHQATGLVEDRHTKREYIAAWNLSDLSTSNVPCASLSRFVDVFVASVWFQAPPEIFYNDAEQLGCQQIQSSYRNLIPLKPQYIQDWI